MIEMFNLGLEIFCRPRKKMTEWKESTFALKRRVNSIVQYKFNAYYSHSILGFLIMVSSLYILSQTRYGIFSMMMLVFSIVGIVLFVIAFIRFVTTVMLLYGNHFNCPRCLLPFVVMNFYFSHIVYSRYKELFVLTTESYKYLDENTSEKELCNKNDVISKSKDEKIDIDIIEEKSNPIYIFIDNQYEDSGPKSISYPEVHKHISK